MSQQAFYETVQREEEYQMEQPKRYQVRGRDMDGIIGYYVIDTQHPLYKKFYNEDFMSSQYTHGLSMNKREMVELADKLNKEAD